jgi:hypothetical protein
MNMETLLTTYALRPVQKEGWNLQVGAFSSGGDLLYVGKSETWGHVAGHDLAIYDSADRLRVTGDDRPYKSWYQPDHVLLRDGEEIGTIRQPRLFTFERLILFPNGESCPFLCTSYPVYKGESDGDWRYEVVADGKNWNVSLWGVPDDLAVLSSLIYFYREWRLSSYDSP